MTMLSMVKAAWLASVTPGHTLLKKKSIGRAHDAVPLEDPQAHRVRQGRHARRLALPRRAALPRLAAVRLGPCQAPRVRAHQDNIAGVRLPRFNSYYTLRKPGALRIALGKG